MILKALTLENFKGIGEAVRIEFAPLTLLFGPNNAGKSTVVQALMYAREVLERNNCDAKSTVLGGSVIDLGGFRSLVHGLDLDREIRMRFELGDLTLPDYVDRSYEEAVEDFIMDEIDWWQGWWQGKPPTIDEISDGLSDLWIQIQIGRQAGSAQPVVKRYQVGAGHVAYATIELRDDDLAAVTSFAFAEPFEGSLFRAPYRGVDLWAPVSENGEPTYCSDDLLRDLFDKLIETPFIPEENAQGLLLRRTGTALPQWGQLLPLHPLVWRQFNAKEASELRSPDSAREYLASVLTSTIVGPGQRLMEWLGNSFYLSPFREMPPRHYRPEYPIDPARWANGLAAWDSIMFERESLSEELNRWLTSETRFNTGYRVEVVCNKMLDMKHPMYLLLTGDPSLDEPDLQRVRDWVRQSPEESRLKIHDLRRGVGLAAQDVGVGISQLVPVIVSALQRKSGVAMIEEPESNIHPSFQVVLADLFITQAKANPEALFLIETHSEHLLLRLLRRIRETTAGSLPMESLKLTRDDLSVLYVESSKEGTRITSLEVAEDGDFEREWPEGFFEERDEELF